MNPCIGLRRFGDVVRCDVVGRGGVRGGRGAVATRGRAGEEDAA